MASCSWSLSLFALKLHEFGKTAVVDAGQRKHTESQVSSTLLSAVMLWSSCKVCRTAHTFLFCLSASSWGADIHTTLYGNTLQCRSSLPTHMLLPAGSLHLQTCRVSNHIIRVLLQHPAALHHDIPCTFASSFILPRFLYLCFHGVTISSLPPPLALPLRAAVPQRTWWPVTTGHAWLHSLVKSANSASTLRLQLGKQLPGIQLKKAGVCPIQHHWVEPRLPRRVTKTRAMSQVMPKGNCQDSRWAWLKDAAYWDKCNQKWQQLAFI